MGNKYYLKGLFTQIIVHSKLRPHSEMMRPFLETRCCCRPNFNFCFYKVNLRKPNKMYIYEDIQKITDYKLINAQSCILQK